MEPQAIVETFNVKEGEQFTLSYQDEVIDAKWVVVSPVKGASTPVVKPPAKDRVLQITVLRRGV